MLILGMWSRNKSVNWLLTTQSLPSPHKVHHQAFVFLRILVTRRQKLIQCDSYTRFWWKKWAKVVQHRWGNFPYLAYRSKIQLKILKIFYFPLCWPLARFGEFLLWMIISVATSQNWKEKKKTLKTLKNPDHHPHKFLLLFFWWVAIISLWRRLGFTLNPNCHQFGC